jgi:sugar phosphate isomerase/epimerase
MQPSTFNLKPSTFHLSLGIVSDELTTDFREALRIAAGWGIRLFELRMLRSGRVPEISNEERRDVRRALVDEDVRVTALSPGLFKYHVNETERLRRDLQELLPRSLVMAAEFDAPAVIVFGFQCDDRSSAAEADAVVEALGRAAELAAIANVELLVENEPGYWCDTGSRTAELLARVDTPNLYANWDPCNAWLGPDDEQPYPAGYDALKPRIRNVHVKDTRMGSLVRCVPVGEGVMDWRGQIAALMRDGIVEHVTIETHCEPLVEMSRHNVAALQALMSGIAPSGTTVDDA